MSSSTTKAIVAASTEVTCNSWTNDCFHFANRSKTSFGDRGARQVHSAYPWSCIAYLFHHQSSPLPNIILTFMSSWRDSSWRNLLSVINFSGSHCCKRQKRGLCIWGMGKVYKQILQKHSLFPGNIQILALRQLPRGKLLPASSLL